MNISDKFTDLRSSYELFEDIPKHRRLYNYEEDFEGTDIWAVYFGAQYNVEEYSEAYIQDVNRVEDNWKTFCEDHDTHHALATPKLVNEWCKQLLEKMHARSAKVNYLIRLKKFYRYLVWHIDYPHWYNPVHYAVCEYKEAKEIWTAVQGGDPDE